MLGIKSGDIGVSGWLESFRRPGSFQSQRGADLEFYKKRLQ